MKNFDVVVVGGGMVGGVCALSLANLGLKIAVVEAFEPKVVENNDPYDLRVSAISIASKQLLEQVNAWDFLSNSRMCPYRRLGVWENESSYTEFDAASIKQPTLGYIIENRLIQLSLWEQLTTNKNVTLFCPEKITNFEQNNSFVTIQLEKESITTHLLLAADGANSKVRELADIGSTGWDYAQSAMLINVETSLAQQDITWQQFHETGPVAMLPLAGVSQLGGCASLVWYHQRDEINRLSSLSNSQLTIEIGKYFPDRLGKVNVINKAFFPLTRRHANTYQNNRVLLVGDAAHTINPMAGQGVNIGFKDAKALQHVIATAISRGENWHEPKILSRYEKARRRDNLLMMSTMDALYMGFGHPFPIIKAARNIGLMFANKSVLFKEKALAYACGL